MVNPNGEYGVWSSPFWTNVIVATALGTILFALVVLAAALG